MDRAIHRDARAVLARRISAHGSGRDESARRDRRAPRAGRGRSLAALARVRRDASMAITDKGVTMHYYDLYESPQGRMLLVANDAGLSGVYFDGQKYLPQVEQEWRRDARYAPVSQAKRELAEYFDGERKRFETELVPEGTPFQQAVWNAISTVAFGETITYSELARRAGCPGSARAAGAATGRNPLTIIVPCHRIVGSNGSLTGYAGGLDRKRALLALESGIPELLAAARRAACGASARTGVSSRL